MINYGIEFTIQVLHVSEMYVFVVDIKLRTFYILDLSWNSQNQQSMDTIIF